MSRKQRDRSAIDLRDQAQADRGEYIASESSFYRVLHQEGQMQHRERARPRTSSKPKEHIATTPNQVWCWDITYLRSSVRGAFFYLYLIVDIYSRKIVGWWIAAEELRRSAELTRCRSRKVTHPEITIQRSDARRVGTAKTET